MSGTASTSFADALNAIGTAVFVHIGVFSRDTIRFANGAMLDLRVSSNVRYPSNFIPTYPAAVDAATVLLFPMDEGSGPTSSDTTATPTSGVQWSDPSHWATCF